MADLQIYQQLAVKKEERWRNAAARSHGTEANGEITRGRISYLLSSLQTTLQHLIRVILWPKFPEKVLEREVNKS